MKPQTDHLVFMYGSNLYLKRLRFRTSSWNGQFKRAVLPYWSLD